MRAIAAALWDIAGKALGVAGSDAAGRVRRAVAGGAVRLANVQGRDTAFMVEDLLHQRERGIGGVKLKVGGVAVSDDPAA